MCPKRILNVDSEFSISPYILENKNLFQILGQKGSYNVYRGGLTGKC